MSTTPPVANFLRAEYEGDPPAVPVCSFCQHPVPTEYYRVASRMACVACAQRAETLVVSDSHKAYVRGTLFGLGGAIAGCAGYAIVQSFGFMIGFVAIGVGWLVGTAMMKGSRGVGGRRYQVTAAVLAYVAIAMAFLPILIQVASQTAQKHPKEHVTFGKFLLGVAILLGFGLVSPIVKFFFSVASGLFGLLFLFFGIQAAWKLTAKRGVEIEGPFEQSPS